MARFTNFNVCQMCRTLDHVTTDYFKYATSRPNCKKCGGLHKMEIFGSQSIFCNGLGHPKEWCWKKIYSKLGATTNYLEVMINDEEITKIQLNKICGSSHELFIHTTIHGRWLHVDTFVKAIKNSYPPKDKITRWKKIGIGFEKKIIVRSKILTHFIKVEISLTPMETIFTVPW